MTELHVHYLNSRVLNPSTRENDGEKAERVPGKLPKAVQLATPPWLAVTVSVPGTSQLETNFKCMGEGGTIRKQAIAYQ